MLNLNNIFLQRGQKILFEDASLSIYVKQKVGIIGANGSGKSTLFSMILGKLAPDRGEVTLPADLRIAHLSQETPSLDISALEYVKQGDIELCEVQAQLTLAEQQQDDNKIAALHARFYDIDGYTANARVARLLNGLGFTDEEYVKPVKAFSGGWRMRLNLAQTLMSRSDMLLLDEPTNHLDLDAILWLENYLKSYSGTLLLISHDREFLDSIIDHIVHIEQQQCKVYTGNYSSFEILRAEQLAREQAKYEKQQKNIAHMMEYVNRFRYKASKAKQAQSRLKAINRLEIVSAVQVDSPFHFEFKEPAKCSNPLLRLEKVDVGYENKIILKNINLSLAPGTRIGLLGPNGAGKSTFIKLLAGNLLPKNGIYETGPGLKIGYYAQHQLDFLQIDESPLEHLKRIDPKATEQQLRNFLGGFDFRNEMALTPITHFSGGEKARLALAILIWQAPNLLLLDEPTNHLDLEMRSALTLALQSYQGAMLIISHDRYLLNATVDEFILVVNRQVQNFVGTIQDYQIELEKIRSKLRAEDREKNEKIKTKEPSQKSSKGNLESKIKKIENELKQTEEELDKLEQTLSDPAVYQADNQMELQQIIEHQKQLREKITPLEEAWLVLHHELEGV